jgi:hypothetical protein
MLRTPVVPAESTYKDVFGSFAAPTLPSMARISPAKVILEPLLIKPVPRRGLLTTETDKAVVGTTDNGIPSEAGIVL